MIRYRDRRAVSIDNGTLRVTVLEEGGHIAEITDLATGVNPLWTPPWASIEPSAYDAARHPEYGGGTDASLLAGIMGHNLCLDIFGGPSDDEAAAGLTAHGEASVARYEIAAASQSLTMSATLPLAQIAVRRVLDLDGRWIRVRESVENLTGIDRPIGWTQHVTLGPPYLEKGATEFRLSAGRSRVFEGTFGPADYLEASGDFTWPMAPLKGGGQRDLRVCNGAPVSSAYTAHLVDPSIDRAWFGAFSPASSLVFGYVWQRADFPWAGLWEENNSRTHSPWNGRTLTRAVEFGVSPYPESRRQMVERGRLFDHPTFRWLPARARLAAEYWIVLDRATAMPENLTPPRS